MRRGWALFLASLSFAAGEAVLPDRTALARAVPLPGSRAADAVEEALSPPPA